MIEERKWPEKERWEKIEEARFNKWYNRVKGKRVPGYLKEGWKEKRLLGRTKKKIIIKKRGGV